MSDAMTVVYFKAIERGFSITPVLTEFSLFGFQYTVRWFGIIAALGFLVAVIFAGRMASKWKMNLDKMIDVLIYSTIIGILGARIWFVIFNWENYKGNISSIFHIWEGGLGLYGGIIGGVITAIVVCKLRKLNLFNLLDISALSVLLGLGIGSWGSFTDQNSFGTNTSLPWGMWSEKISGYISLNADAYAEKGIALNAGTFAEKAYVHPVFLYESLWCLLGFFALMLIYRKFRKFSGQLILSCGIWFGIGQIVIEGLRPDSLTFMDTKIRVFQVASAALVLVSTAALITLLRKFKKNPKPVEGVDFFPVEEEKQKTAKKVKQAKKAVAGDDEPDEKDEDEDEDENEDGNEVEVDENIITAEEKKTE